LLLPPAAAARLAGAEPSPPARATVRALPLDDVPLLTGLLIRLGVERAEAPHDDLPALTPAQLEEWLQRPGTVAYAAWEATDAQSPLGLAWATRRPEDGVLRFVGVHDEARRRGIGRALVGALAEALARPPGAAGPAPGARFRPLRAQLHEPGAERDFFQRLGFEAERITHRLARALG
jgi:GNAT superfamily N-acetyltransferase